MSLKLIGTPHWAQCEIKNSRLFGTLLAIVDTSTNSRHCVAGGPVPKPSDNLKNLQLTLTRGRRPCPKSFLQLGKFAIDAHAWPKALSKKFLDIQENSTIPGPIHLQPQNCKNFPFLSWSWQNEVASISEAHFIYGQFTFSLNILLLWKS